jgi:hypothetical protein
MAMNMARLEVFSQSHHYNRVKRLTVFAEVKRLTGSAGFQPAWTGVAS